MERLLQPKCFDVATSDPQAQHKWEHWHRTFCNFAQISQANDEEKLLLLVNYVSTEVYTHISACVDYVVAIAKLDSLYIKPRNISFSRYALSSRRQQINE